jgi:hypothetical protein
VSLRNSNYLRFSACAALLFMASTAYGVTFKGVVSDSVNGMLIDSVRVSVGGATTLTDSKGSFTLDAPASALEKSLVSGYFSSLQWDPESGHISWDERLGAVKITVYSLKGDAVAQLVPMNGLNSSTLSLAHLRPGIYMVSAIAQGLNETFRFSYLKDGRQRTIVLVPMNTVPLAKNAASQADYMVTFSKSNFDTLKLGVSASATSDIAAKMKSPYPLRNILHLLTDPSVPERGPGEYPPTPRCATNNTVENLIGGQLQMHDFLMIGESHRRINIVIGGKVAWHYDTQNDWEDDEAWVLSNGHVLHGHMHYIEEIAPNKEIVWHYDNPAGTEIHTCQPIGIDKVLFLQNETGGARVRLYNKVTKTYEVDKLLTNLAGAVHGQCRRLRMTAKGTYILGTMSTGTFLEYDKDFNLLWSQKAGSMWGGVPLTNGNFLLTREGAKTAVEMNRAGETIWSGSIAEVQSQLDVLAPGSNKIANTQTSERLANGNTVITTRDCDAKLPQAVEITPDKKVVWILKEWKNLGDAVSLQFLDQPGYPEVPGATNH